MSYLADRDLYTDATRTLVLEEGDTRQAWVLVAKGCLLPDEEAIRYGLTPNYQPPILAPTKFVTFAPWNKRATGNRRS